MIPDALRPFMPFKRLREGAPLVTVLRLDGIIGRAGPFRGALAVQRLAPAIERAFAPKRLAAVALVVNSPGGSPVQSSLIHARIRALADEKGVPVLAFVEDVAASGGYWLALAGDEIWADASSIVGSIGVVSRSFGLVDAIARIGVERRVHATGPRKPAFDPFRPESPEDAAMIEAVQADIFTAFKEVVRARRGARLKGPDDELFSGAFWAGKGALDLGLIDGLGEPRALLRERFGDRVRLRAVNRRGGWFRRRLGGTGPTGGMAGALAGGVAEAALAAAEERALWGRYGL